MINLILTNSSTDANDRNLWDVVTDTLCGLSWTVALVDGVVVSSIIFVLTKSA